ncbi:uncharacterized protein LOC130584318 isoform X2 [Malurus melanocephalus]|uniref:uncharacterized protein LOC130584318 isoform X2 n=1 Tax=Malurus melanocephalus TaxID=175006 RepID=UPI00254776FF|nr:uncharacterized protein LOC130584318 isoform X2 [Malurus melanocephalus]
MGPSRRNLPCNPSRQKDARRNCLYLQERRTMALGDRSPPTAPGECGFYSSFTLRNQVTTLEICVRWYQNGRECHSRRSLSLLCIFGHSTKILRGLHKIPLHHSFREEIWSFIHLCYMKDDFSMASIGGFCNELFLKILSLSFEKKLQAYRTFRGCAKSDSIPRFPGKRLNAKNFGKWRRETL